MTRTLNQDDLNQWLELSIETFADQGYDSDFVGVTDITIKRRNNSAIIRCYH